MNILDIEVPLIAAVNGPVRLHSEYILLADIVTPTTVFQDKPHFELGVASGDGVHLLWQEAIGSIRGRYFIMTRQGVERVRSDREPRHSSICAHRAVHVNCGTVGVVRLIGLPATLQVTRRGLAIHRLRRRRTLSDPGDAHRRDRLSRRDG